MNFIETKFAASTQPSSPPCQARSTSGSVTRSDTSQKLKLDNLEKVMEDVSFHSDHIVGSRADSPPQSERVLSCLPQHVHGHNQNCTETLAESHPVSDPVRNTKGMHGNSKWTPELDRNPTSGRDINEDKGTDKAENDWFADVSTTESLEEPSQVRKTSERLGTHTVHARDAEGDVITTWTDSKSPSSQLEKPGVSYPGAWPRSATPSPSRRERAISKALVEEITIDSQAQPATSLYCPSAHALASRKTQTNTMEYSQPFDKSSGSLDVTIQESVTGVKHSGCLRGFAPPPSEPGSPLTHGSPSYQIFRSHIKRSISEGSKAAVSPPRTKIEKKSKCESPFYLTDTENSMATTPEEAAWRKNITHRVSSGGSRAYTHKMASPQYIDSHEDPYAVFIFKYRSKCKSFSPRSVSLRALSII